MCKWWSVLGRANLVSRNSMPSTKMSQTSSNSRKVLRRLRTRQIQMIRPSDFICKFCVKMHFLVKPRILGKTYVELFYCHRRNILFLTLNSFFKVCCHFENLAAIIISHWKLTAFTVNFFYVVSKTECFIINSNCNNFFNTTYLFQRFILN